MREGGGGWGSERRLVVRPEQLLSLVLVVMSAQLRGVVIFEHPGGATVKASESERHDDAGHGAQRGSASEFMGVFLVFRVAALRGR